MANCNVFSRWLTIFNYRFLFKIVPLVVLMKLKRH